MVSKELNWINEGKKVIDIEIKALEIVKNNIDESFKRILDIIVNCKGKVVISGMGKSGHIGRKMAATFASLGTPSFFLHPAEAVHGDLGMLTANDVIIIISFSGESDEIKNILSNIKIIGATIIGISGNEKSTLIKYSDAYQIFPCFEEACYMGLAPTSSTTVALAYGDALAVVASKIYGFSRENFGLFHPAGSLGKKLIVKVGDIMEKGEENAVVNVNAGFKDAIVELGKKGLGMVTVVDDDQMIEGIITEGDLRRLLENEVDLYSLNVKQIMKKNPTIFIEDIMAVEALSILKEKNIGSAPVVNQEGSLVGAIRLQDILKAGIVI
jgi:arabinose-5-phosphate isomerase